MWSLIPLRKKTKYIQNGWENKGLRQLAKSTTKQPHNQTGSRCTYSRVRLCTENNKKNARLTYWGAKKDISAEKMSEQIKKQTDLQLTSQKSALPMAVSMQRLACWRRWPFGRGMVTEEVKKTNWVSDENDGVFIWHGGVSKSHVTSSYVMSRHFFL